VNSLLTEEWPRRHRHHWGTWQHSDSSLQGERRRRYCLGESDRRHGPQQPCHGTRRTAGGARICGRKPTARKACWTAFPPWFTLTIPALVALPRGWCPWFEERIRGRISESP